MPRDAHSKQGHQHLCPPPSVDHCEDAVAYGEPHERHRGDLHSEGYGAMFAEVADIGAQILLVDEPMV